MWNPAFARTAVDTHACRAHSRADIAALCEGRTPLSWATYNEHEEVTVPQSRPGPFAMLRALHRCLAGIGRALDDTSHQG